MWILSPEASVAIEFLPPDSSYYVYALLCQDGEGPLYIKFGRTTQPTRRLSGLRVGCPIEPRYFCTVQVPYQHAQRQLEKALHEEFKERRTVGEWFKFDAYDPSDKQQFQKGCALQMMKVLGPGYKWEKISVRAKDAHEKERRKAMFSSGHFGRIQAKQQRKDKRERAWRELDNFR